MLRRTLEKILKKACQTFPAVIVTGPRQAGKTTLLRTCLASSHRYASLENPNIRARARSDPVGFLNDHAAPIILDEIQYVPELLPYIKTHIDANRAVGQWVLTGSQHFPLMQNVSESLAGRIAILNLLPFSISEAANVSGRYSSVDHLLKFLFSASRKPLKAPPFKLSDWLLRGGYPEIRTKKKVDRNLWCASYIQTYLERDVRTLVEVGNLNTFERFLRLLAGRTAQVLNLASLGNDVGVSAPTIRSWVSLLEASGQIYLLPPYHTNFGKRLIKSPKVYWLDTALATFLIGLHHSEPLMQGPFIGPLMETVVVSEWVKAFRHRGEIPSLYYWRSHDGLEVDLIVEQNGILYPMEIKASQTIVPSHAQGLIKFKQLTKNPHAVVVGNIDEMFSLAPGIRAVPWYVI